MTKHDTWVKLKPGNPLEPILDLFPEGMIPMRDPFPLERAEFGSQSLWIIDIERLSSVQANTLCQVIAYRNNADPIEVAQEAATRGGFALRDGWAASMSGGAESFQRTKELADFLETAPQPPSAEAWIEGDEEPPPVDSLEDIDSRLHTPELEEAMRQKKIQQLLAEGNYSVFDVLTGRAMVEILNQIDPDNEYSLADTGRILRMNGTNLEKQQPGYYNEECQSLNNIKKLIDEAMTVQLDDYEDTKSSTNEFVNVPKDLYVLNCLAMGVAIQFLAKVTGEEIKDWREHIRAVACDQYESLSSQEIQEIVDSPSV